MEYIKKILRTPSAFVLLLIAIVSLIGIIIQSKTNENIARLPIDATSTAEAKLTMVANSATQASLPQNAPTALVQQATITETPNLTSMDFPHYAPVYIRYLFPFRDYNDDYKWVCKTLEGYYEWEIETVLAFEIVSVSDTAIDLYKVLPDNGEIIDTKSENIRASANYYFFNSQDDFLNWYKVRSSPNSSYIDSRKNLVFSTPPITIDSGQMIDVLLLVKQKAIFDSSFATPQDIFLKLKDTDWQSKVTFVFSDNEIQEVSIPLIHPYQYSISANESFPICQP